MATYVQKVVPAIAAFGMAAQLAAPALAQYNPNYNNSNGAYTPPPSYQQPQQGQVGYVPAGITFPISLRTSISTDVANPGDLVQAQLTQPIQLGNGIVPAGSQISGTVVSAKSGGFLGRAGMLTIKFNRLQTPNGIDVPMSAHIVNKVGKYSPIAAQSDTFAGETWKTKVGQGAIRTGVGAGLGAGVGTAIGAIAGRGGRGAGRGAWSGAAIGGGLGLADSLLLRKGKQVIISSGTNLDLQLDSPITLSSNPQQYGAF